jgi:hypothetical protein
MLNNLEFGISDLEFGISDLLRFGIWDFGFGIYYEFEI